MTPPRAIPPSTNRPAETSLSADDHPQRRHLHGTAVAIEGLAALIRGPSGSGKSDLALRCIGLPAGPLMRSPFQLVADDRVFAELCDGRLLLTCPEPLSGLLEVRGLGILPMPTTSSARLVLVADLAESRTIERLPQLTDRVDMDGISVPRVWIAPFEASAPLKLALALQAASAVA